MKRKIKVFLFFLILIILVGIVIYNGVPEILSEKTENFKTQKEFSMFFFNKEKIGILEIKGAIFESQEILEKLDKLVNDDSVKGIIVRINSPGGAVGASQEICKALEEMRKKKIIVSSIENIGASGAYYIALGTEKIFSNPGAITGSIGVIMEFYNSSKLWDKIGVSFKTIKSGKYKDIGNPVREMTEEEKKLLQSASDDVYNQFLAQIKKSRKKILEKKFKKLGFKTLDSYINFIANGKIFTGRQAYKYGLIDELGNIYDAAEYIKGKLKLKGKIEFYYPKNRKYPFFLSFLNNFSLKENLPLRGINMLYIVPFSK